MIPQRPLHRLNTSVDYQNQHTKVKNDKGL
jgi:hypothetical protein